MIIPVLISQLRKHSPAIIVIENRDVKFIFRCEPIFRKLGESFGGHNLLEYLRSTHIKQ